MRSCLAASASAPVVDFPSSESHSGISLDVPYTGAVYLPFRRISLPSAPSLVHRQSIVSTASFDSLPEEPGSIGINASSPISPLPRSPDRPGFRNQHSSELARRAGRRQSVRVVDPNLETKRRRVITEFCETEKSYVDGLELIHSVSVDLM